MKKFIFLFLITTFCFSQEVDIPSENYFWEYNYLQNTEGVIGVKNCYVRSEPSSNSVLKDSIQMGQNITIKENTTKNTNIKGLNLSWVAIEYYKNNQIYTGYLWKGFIAINSVINTENKFITTLDRKFTKKIKQDDYEYDATIFGLSTKVLDINNKLITEKSFTKQLSDSYSSYASVIDNWGLQNLQKIYRFGIGGEACGVPTEYNYFGFTGSELLALPEKYDVGDANAYYHSENFIFPEEKGGQPNTIIKEIFDAENTSVDLSGDVFMVNKKIEYFSWDGKTFKLIKTKKFKPYKEKS
jgi:hypothetical protein